MTETDWRSLEGEVLDSKFEIGEFIKPVDNGALFRARGLTDRRDLLVRLEDEKLPSAVHDFDRFREAAFLRHPNLVEVLAVGRSDGKGWSFIYLLTETADLNLAAALERGPVGLDEVSGLLKDLAASLAYVHSENLVYCGLRTGSVWRVGTQWKLADYTQLRVAGKYPAAETRQLMLSPDFEAPPESNEGLVSVKWDVWSLGSMLRKILLPHVEPDAARPNRPVPLQKLSIPPPFDRILREALAPDPESRATLERVLELLAEPPVQAPEPEPVMTMERPMERPMESEPATAETFVEPAIRHVPLPRSFSAAPERRRRRPAPIIVGGILAAAAAVVLALVFPSRMVHPEPVRHDAPPAAAAKEPEVKEPAVAKSVPEPAPAPDAGLRTQEAISSLLERWADATRKRNVDEQINCYAPLVDRFFGQRSVSSSRLRSQEQNVFARVGAVRKFEISNIQFNKVGPQWAVVSFDKNWDFRGRTRFSGSAREEVILRPIRGQWKIASEREVKVYWVNKQAT